MNKLLTSVAAALVVFGSSFGTLAQEANSLLWKVTGKDITKPSYLFGTIHLLPEDDYFFNEKMQSALSDADVLALEVDMNVSMADQMKMAGEMIMPDGKSWADYMTEEEYAAVKSAFVDSLGIKEKKVDKYAKIRPIYVSGLILTELLGKVKMYEKELTNLAKKEKKTIIGLETLAEQMEIVSSIPVEDQVEDMKTTTASMLREYNEMLKAYTSQNLEELEQVATDAEGFDKMEGKLLVERNERWIKEMESLLAKQSTFYAVGAMHLIGENGLIPKLKEAGYTVEAIN